MDDKLSLKYQLVSAWCGPAFLITFVLFWGVIGQNLPNPSPALSAVDLGAATAPTSARFASASSCP